MKYGRKILEIAVGILLLLWCILNFSAFFSNFFQSDNAIQVLQIYNFHFPQDLYYRGQDRLGSLLPVLGLIPYMFGLPALVSATIVQVGFWIGLALCGRYILRTTFSRIVWYAALFLPLVYVAVFVQIGHPYSAATLLTLLAYISFDKKANNYWNAIIVAILLSLGLWVSELTLVPIVLIAFEKIYYQQGKISVKNIKFRFPFKWEKWLVPFFLTIASFIVIIYIVKSYTINDGRYSKMLANPYGIIANIEEVCEVILKNLFSKVLFVALGYWLFVISTIVALWATVKQNNKHVWRWFFLTLGLFMAIILSNWVYKMGSSLHYYAAVFPFYILWIVSLAENTRFKLVSKILPTAMLIVIIVLHVNYIKYLNIYDFKIGTKPNLTQIENASANIKNEILIGDYWYAYVFAGRHPEKFTVIPKPGDFIRGFWQIPKILKADFITVIGNNWLNVFPDTINLYGNSYLRNNKPTEINKIRFCTYKKLQTPVDSVLNCKDLTVGFGTIISSGKDSVLEAKPIDFNKVPFLIYGNYSQLNAGKYKVQFHLNYIPEKPIPYPHFAIEVVTNFGKKVLASEQFGWLIDNSDTMVYTLDFELKKLTGLLEYRVLYYGNGTITFKKVIISKQD